MSDQATNETSTSQPNNAGIQCEPKLLAATQDLGLEKIQRHIFLCADPTKPKCCDQKTSLEAWNYLKRRLKELNWQQSNTQIPGYVFRTKANCLQVCRSGPIMLVYPDGVWYRNATPEVIERVLQEHLLGDQVVEEYAFVTHPLPSITQ